MKTKRLCEEQAASAIAYGYLEFVEDCLERGMAPAPMSECVAYHAEAQWGRNGPMKDYPFSRASCKRIEAGAKMEICSMAYRSRFCHLKGWLTANR